MIPAPPLHPPAAPVLIVDDEEPVRRVYAETLQQAGFETLEAADGRQALALLEQTLPSLVLLDNRMPGLSGLDVLTALRQGPATRTLPVIFVTASTDAEDRIRALEAGAHDYLSKPVMLAELVARVRAHLRVGAESAALLRQMQEERSALASIIRKIRIEDSPERTARGAARQIAEAIGVDSVVLLRLDPDGSAQVLASQGALASSFPAGETLTSTLGRSLEDRAIHGGWLPESLAGSLPSAVFPLRHDDKISGLLLIGDPDASPAGRLRRLPLLMECADFVASLLAPGIDVQHRILEIRDGLRQIVDRREFHPVFQPVVELDTGRTVGHEALTRFIDRVRPDLRFQAAERVGMGQELEFACLEASVEASRALPPDTWVSLNVSPALVLDASVNLAALLGKLIRPVVLEITEHTRVPHYGEFRAALQKLGTKTFLSIDDVGAGFSTLSHIMELRPHYVKLDIAFTRGIERDPVRQAMVSGIVYFAGRTDCRLIAEGVETEAERETLKVLGVRLGQGYLLGRPAPAP